MELNITLDDAQIKATIVDTLNSLTPEQKQSLALQSFKQVFTKQLNYVDQIVIDNEICDYLKNKYPKDYAYKSNQEIIHERDYYFRKELENREPFLLNFNKQILSEMKKEAQDKINSLVSENENFKKSVSFLVEQIKANFPQMVQNAVQLHLAQEMASLFSNLQQALNKGDSNARYLDQIFNQNNSQLLR